MSPLTLIIFPSQTFYNVCENYISEGGGHCGRDKTLFCTVHLPQSFIDQKKNAAPSIWANSTHNSEDFFFGRVLWPHPGPDPLFLPGGPNGPSRHFLAATLGLAILFPIICPHTNFQDQQSTGADSLLTQFLATSTSFFKFGVSYLLDLSLMMY